MPKKPEKPKRKDKCPECGAIKPKRCVYCHRCLHCHPESKTEANVCGGCDYDRSNTD